MDPFSFNDRREHALAIHRAGRVAEAKTIYLDLLGEKPDNADVMGLLAMARFQGGELDEAKRLWWESIGRDALASVRLRNINNLMVTLREENSREDMKRLADIPLPEWPQGQMPEQIDRNNVVSLAGMLSEIGRKEAALRLLQDVMPHLPGDVDVVSGAAALMLELGLARDAGALLETLSDADQGRADVLALRGAAASALGEQENARRITKDFVEAAPVCLTERTRTQTMLIGVVNQAPAVIDQANSPIGLHFSGNTPGLLARDFNHRYRFASIFAEAQSANAALSRLPPLDLVINNWVNAEALSVPHALTRLADFVDNLGLPIINHPRGAAELTRQKNAHRLAQIDNLVVPKVQRFENDANHRETIVRMIEAELSYPVLVRTPFAQEGRELWRADSRAGLTEALDGIGRRQFYAIQYVDNPTGKGVYRKIRAAIIGPDIFITHAHFAKEWCVHRTDDDERADLLERDPTINEYRMRVVAEPDIVLGPAAMKCLAAIRAAIPLELFGIDFDLMPDGRLLLFEANATMRISFAGKARSVAEDRKREEAAAALDRLFRSTASRSGSARLQ